MPPGEGTTYPYSGLLEPPPTPSADSASHGSRCRLLTAELGLLLAENSRAHASSHRDPLRFGGPFGPAGVVLHLQPVSAGRPRGDRDGTGSLRRLLLRSQILEACFIRCRLDRPPLLGAERMSVSSRNGTTRRERSGSHRRSQLRHGPTCRRAGNHGGFRTVVLCFDDTTPAAQPPGGTLSVALLNADRILSAVAAPSAKNGA